jgi:tRNA modification GTPase
LNEAGRQLDTLLDRARVGLHLVKPWHVVLAGPPNVGKSSLVNALLGYGRAIVDHQPGTTRDVVTAVTALDGWPLQLADTAGLRVSADLVEAAGVQQAQERMARADLVLLVFDASAPWTSVEQTLVESFPAACLVHNKADLGTHPGSSRPPGVWTSTLTPGGIKPVLQEIERALGGPSIPAGAAVPFTADQLAALQAARNSVQRADGLQAVDHLRVWVPEKTGDT